MKHEIVDEMYNTFHEKLLEGIDKYNLFRKLAEQIMKARAKS